MSKYKCKRNIVHRYIFSYVCLIISFAMSGIYAKCDLKSPDSTYQITGPYTTIKDSIVFDRDADDVYMYIFRPAEKKTKSPVIIFCHQFGLRSPLNYSALINHLVSKGNVVFYPPSFKISIKGNRTNTYQISFDGIENALHKALPYIDTTKIGFVGHGFGGGAIPALARKCYTENNWGHNGSFIYIASPWYMYSIDDREVATFPDSMNMILQVFTDDRINDPKIAIDIFNSLSIPPERKRFFIMSSDKRDSCELKATFSVPEEAMGNSTDGNFLDIYGIFRVIDALSDYTFSKDQKAYDFVFGAKGKHFLSMGTWNNSEPVKPILVTDSLSADLFERHLYVNQWRSLRNPRIAPSEFRKSRKAVHNYRRKIIRMATNLLFGKQKNNRNNFSPYDTVVNPIPVGYGADGHYAMRSDTVPNPYVSSEMLSGKMPVYFFTPEGHHEPTPVIIILHGYIGQNPEEFSPFIEHIVSKGYSVIYPTYPFLPNADDSRKIIDKYRYMYAGIAKAARMLAWRIDTSRVGFFGQSFGAGAIPSVAYRTLVKNGWGKKGAFMFITAPWYSYDITEEQLKNFPPNTKMLVQIYDDDQMNDHAMAIDIFNSISIPGSEKNFMTLYSDSLDGFQMQANHFVPYGPKNVNGDLNNLDYYGIYKMFDALADYAFTGNSKAKNIALGNGSPEQIFMGKWSDDKDVHHASVTGTPKPTHPELHYVNSWSSPLNPRFRK